MAKSLVTCQQCNVPFERENKEINRSMKLGRLHFCTQTCAAVYANEPRKALELKKVCGYCGTTFPSSTKVRAASFCSSRCATLGSETKERAEGRSKGGLKSVHNLLPTHDVLRRREAPKYQLIAEKLREREHVFEFPLEGYVFDLALLDAKVLVEFDGRYHQSPKQQATDALKDEAALAQGFRVLRVEVPDGEPIPLSVLQQII